MSTLFSKPPHPPTISVKAHTLSVPSEDLDELRALLKSARLTRPTYESSTQAVYLGVKRDWVAEARRYWLEEYNWKTQQDRLNTFPQFTASLKTHDDIPMSIHFAAVFSSKPDATPVIFSHGWPGCWIEFAPMMEMVMKKYTPDTLPCHIIVPSLPGFTHSSPPPTTREFALKDTAYLWNQLMTGLGFSQYYAQGGDIGSFLSWQLARDFDECLGLHVNFLAIKAPPAGTPEFEKSTGPPRPQEVLKGLQAYGYALEQGTRPSAIGMVVGSSPLSLLTWTGEKYLEASGIQMSLDTLLTFVSLYWFTDCYASGIWYYRYLMGSRAGPGADPSQSGFLNKPLGYSLYPKEIAQTPVHWAEKLGDLIWSKVHEGKGGHFAALECPESMWADVLDFLLEAEKKQKAVSVSHL